MLLLLGLFTRPVAFLLAGEMAVAYFQFHAPQGFWPVAERRRRGRALLLRLALLLGRRRRALEPRRAAGTLSTSQARAT